MSNARKLDQFFTKTSVAEECFQFLNQHTSTKNCFYLEPSAGGGAFLSLLPANKRLGLDLDPKLDEIQQMDFFEFSAEQLPAKRRIIVIGNPPFGKNSSLALRFVNKAADFASVVAFVLPCTFKKDSLVQKIHPNLHLVAELPLGPNSFEFEGQPYDVPCVFQVWEKRKTPRTTKMGPLTHPDFAFCAAAEADFAIRRVGGLAGKLIENFGGYSAASHYYLKSNIDVAQCKRTMQAANWDDVRHLTAGNPSISKRELVRLYAEAKARLAPPAADCAGEPSSEFRMAA